MNKNIKRQQGVVAIETAIGFPALIIMILLWAEISYVGFVSSVIDIASSTAVRQAKNTDIDLAPEASYSAIVQGTLSQSGSFWANIVDPNNFVIVNCYYSDLASATVGSLNGCNNNSANNPVGVFQVSYSYQPIYSIFINTIDLSRELIVVLEFERNT